MKNMRQSVKLDHNFPGDRLSNPLNLVISLAVQHPFFGPMVFFERPGPFRNLQTEKKKNDVGGHKLRSRACLVVSFGSFLGRQPWSQEGAPESVPLTPCGLNIRDFDAVNARITGFFWGMRFTPFPIENQGLCGCFQK